MPGIGASYEHEHPALAGLRVFPISRFKKYLVFYRPVADGIEILRVLHGARDFHGLLGEGFDLLEDDEDGAATEDPEAS
jgi:toxin ParE1/3/4